MYHYDDDDDDESVLEKLSRNKHRMVNQTTKLHEKKQREEGEELLSSSSSISSMTTTNTMSSEELGKRKRKHRKKKKKKKKNRKLQATTKKSLEIEQRSNMNTNNDDDFVDNDEEEEEEFDRMAMERANLAARAEARMNQEYAIRSQVAADTLRNADIRPKEAIVLMNELERNLQGLNERLQSNRILVEKLQSKELFVNTTIENTSKELGEAITSIEPRATDLKEFRNYVSRVSTSIGLNAQVILSKDETNGLSQSQMNESSAITIESLISRFSKFKEQYPLEYDQLGTVYTLSILLGTLILKNLREENKWSPEESSKITEIMIYRSCLDYHIDPSESRIISQTVIREML